MKMTLKTSAIILTLFALLTLFMSGSVIFDLFGIREKEGNYVLFIVVANFVAGLLYLLSAYGMFTTKPWAFQLLLAITCMLILAFIGLLIHAYLGGIYETQTLKAMMFRIGLTALMTGIAWQYISKNTVKNKS
jgi:hypothetical protein